LRQNKCRLSLCERTFLRGAKDDNTGNLFWRGALVGIGASLFLELSELIAQLVELTLKLTQTGAQIV
jgi:hypothetical protein